MSCKGALLTEDAVPDDDVEDSSIESIGLAIRQCRGIAAAIAKISGKLYRDVGLVSLWRSIP